MEFPRRVFDGEGVSGDVDFGPTLMLNRQRCILCTRCVRFMRDDRRRRADQHHRPRLRQRDRDLPGRGRALADLRQPDGRLPGRRDHDARLPLQVAPVGQPERRRHDLHDLFEGLQHDGVAESQAGMGQGIAPDSHHAALQSGRQRLLDVRHRTFRLPLDRKRRSPAPADGPGRARAFTRRLARADLGAADPARRRSARRIPTAFAFCCPRTRLTRSCFSSGRSPRDCSAPKDGTRLRSAGASATRCSPNARPSACRRSTRPTSTARACSDWRADRAAIRRARRISTRCGAPSMQARSPRSMCSIPGRTDRSATSQWIVDARQSGKLPVLIVQGVLLTRLAQCGGFRPPGCILGRKGSVLHQRPGTAAGNGAGDAAARRSARRLAASWPISAATLGLPIAYSGEAQVRADIATRFAGVHGLEGLPTSGVRASGLGPHLAADVEPVGAVEVGFHVSGSAAGQRDRRSRGAAAAARRHSAAGSEVRCRQRVTVGGRALSLGAMIVLAAAAPARRRRRPPRAQVTPIVEQAPAAPSDGSSCRAAGPPARGISHQLQQAARTEPDSAHGQGRAAAGGDFRGGSRLSGVDRPGAAGRGPSAARLRRRVRDRHVVQARPERRGRRADDPGRTALPGVQRDDVLHPGSDYDELGR